MLTIYVIEENMLIYARTAAFVTCSSCAQLWLVAVGVHQRHHQSCHGHSSHHVSLAL